MDENKNNQLYQQAVDGLDVKYIDGTAYMSVHTIDVINAALADIMGTVQEQKHAQGEQISPDFVRGVILSIGAWESLHDELSIREAAHKIPDFVPEDFDQ